MKKNFKLVTGSVGLVAAVLLLAGYPAQAAREIYDFSLGRDTISRDGNNTTGDYSQAKYGIRDMVSLFAYNALVYTKVASIGDTSPSLTTNSTYGVLSYGNWFGEAAGTVKIDADRFGYGNGVYRLDLKSFIAPLPVSASWPNLTTALKTSTKYIVVFPKMTVDNFDVDASNGTVPMVLKQDGNAATGDKLVVAKAMTGTASSSLSLVGSKFIDLPTGATINLDADSLPAGKFTVKLKAYMVYSGKEKAVMSANSFAITVLPKPAVTKQSVTDATATQTGPKPSACTMTTSNVGGDNKLVFKWDATNLTKMTIVLNNAGTDYTFGVSSPNGAGKFMAIDANCLPKNLTYTAKINFENTSAYQDSINLGNVAVK